MKISTINRLGNLIDTATDAAVGITQSITDYKYSEQSIVLQKRQLQAQIDRAIATDEFNRTQEGINSILYSSKDGGHIGWFDTVLQDDMQYGKYQEAWDNKYNEIMNVDFLTSTYNISEENAQRFIDERGEDIKRAGDNTVNDMKIQAGITRLGMAQEELNKKNAIEYEDIKEGFKKSEKGYEKNGGISVDILQQYNPSKTGQRANFAYTHTLHFAKKYVDENVSSLGFNKEDTIKKLLSDYDSDFDSLSDNTSEYNLIKDNNRDTFEGYIREYINQQAGYAYAYSSDKLFGFTDFLAVSIINDEIVTDEKFDEMFYQSGGDLNNAYDRDLYIKSKESIKSNNSSLMKLDSNKYNETEKELIRIFNNPNQYSDSQWKQALDDSILSGKVSMSFVDEYSKKDRYTPYDEMKKTVMETVKSFIKSNTKDADEANQVIYDLNLDIDGMEKIEQWCMVNPNATSTDIKKYAEEVYGTLSMNKVAKDLDKATKMQYMELTGFMPKVNLENKTASDIYQGVLSGDLALFIDYDSGTEIKQTISTGKLNENQLNDYISDVLYGMKYNELSENQKNILEINKTVAMIDVQKYKIAEKVAFASGTSFKEFHINNRGAAVMDKDGIIYIPSEDGKSVDIGIVDKSSSEYRTVWSDDYNPEGFSNKSNSVYFTHPVITKSYSVGNIDKNWLGFEKYTEKEQYEIVNDPILNGIRQSLIQSTKKVK